MRLRGICCARGKLLMLSCALGVLLVTRPTAATEEHSLNADDAAVTPEGGTKGDCSATLDAETQKLRARGEEYARFVQQTPHESRWIYLNETAKFDEVLRNVLLSAVQEVGSFEDLMGRFSDVIQWQELPSPQAAGSLLSVNAPMVIGMERDVLAGLPERPLPIVLYRHVEMEPGAELALLMNAFVTKEQRQFFRIRTPPYAIASWNGKTHLSNLTQQFSVPGSEPWAGGHDMVIVDTFSSEERFPYVGIIEGPSGNAGGLTVSIVRYDEAKNRWDGFWGFERSGVSGWRYKLETKTLQMEWHTGKETGVEELGMHALLEEGRRNSALRDDGMQERLAQYKAAKRDWWENQLRTQASDENERKRIEAVFALDDQLQQLIETAFQRMVQFDEVCRALEGVVDFTEMPQDYVKSADVRQAIQQAKVLTDGMRETPSLVYYQHLSVDAEREFYVMHIMTPPWWRGTVPLSHSLAVMSGGKARYYRLPEVKNARSSAYFVDLYPEPVCVVPLFLTGSEYPDIAVVKGPDQRNESCRLYAVVYDDIKDEWTRIVSQRFNFPDWSIDPQSHEFRPISSVSTVQPSSESESPSSIDLVEWFRNSRASWEATGRKTITLSE